MKKLNKKAEGEGGLEKIGKYLIWIIIFAILLFTIYKLKEKFGL